MVIESQINKRQLEILLTQCYLLTIYLKIFLNFNQMIAIIVGIGFPWQVELTSFLKLIKYLTFFTQFPPSFKCLYDGI